MQERHVGRADERQPGPVADAASPVAMPRIGPSPSTGSSTTSHPRRQLGQLLPGRGDDDDRAVDGAGEQRGGAVQQRRAVPLQRGLGRAHPRRPAAGEHDSRGICEPGHDLMLAAGSALLGVTPARCRHTT